VHDLDARRATRGGQQGVGPDGVYGFLSLTALRFPLDAGVPLTNDGNVTIHRVLNGTQAILRGLLLDKVYRRDGRLLLIPLEFQPAEDTHFCTCSEGHGAAPYFNLVEVVSRRFVSGTGFVGGEVLWKDGFWERSHVAVSGVMYPILEEFHVKLEIDEVDLALRTQKAVKHAQTFLDLLSKPGKH
jgi:hypothetical protein